MTIQPAGGGGGGGGGGMARPNSSGLADVIDTILDKGLVIDAFVRVSLVVSNCSPSTPASSWPVSTPICVSRKR